MAEKTRKQRLEEMLADEPNDAFLRYGLAMEYASEGNDEEALRCLRRMFADDQDFAPEFRDDLGAVDRARGRQGVAAIERREQPIVVRLPKIQRVADRVGRRLKQQQKDGDTRCGERHANLD